MNDSRAWTRPRLFLALLLAALVAGAVPVRMAAARREKPSGTASWRAAAVRPVAVRPDVDPHAAPPVAAAAPEPLPLPKIIRADSQQAARSPHPLPPLARSPLPRAPPPRSHAHTRRPPLALPPRASFARDGNGGASA